MTTPVRVTAGIVVEVLRQVVAEPIRTGRLRAAGWPAGVRMIVGIALAVYLVGLVAAVTAPVLRGLLGHDNRAGFPDALLPVLVIVVAVIVGLAVTGSLHAPWPLRVAALLLALVVDVRLGSWGTTGGIVLISVPCWFPLLGFAIWRWRRSFVWWEYVVAQLLVATPFVLAGRFGLQYALTGGILDEWSTAELLLFTVTPFAFPFAMLAGLALSEVAFSTSVWLVETVATRVPVIVLSFLTAALAVVTIGSCAEGWYTDVLPVSTQLVVLANSAALLALTLVGWRLVDRIARGDAAGSTSVHQLLPRARILGAGISLITMLPVMIMFILQAGWSGLSPLAEDLGVSRPQINTLVQSGPVLRSAGLLVAAVLAVITALLLAARRRRGTAKLSIIMGIVGLERGMRVWGWLQTGTGTVAVGSLAAGLALVLAVVWLFRRRMSALRVEMVASALLLVLAYTHRDLIADPLNVLLGAGGALLAFGLVWSLLTGAQEANGDSPRFPRPARAILVAANLALVMTVLAADRLANTSVLGLDAVVSDGADALGDPLLIAGLWAVLAAGWRDGATADCDDARAFAGRVPLVE